MLVDLVREIQEKVWDYLPIEDLKNISLTCRQQNDTIVPYIFRCVQIHVEGAEKLLTESLNDAKLLQNLGWAEHLRLVGDEKHLSNEDLSDCVVSFVQEHSIFTRLQSLTLSRLDLVEKQFEVLCSGLLRIKKLVLFAISDTTLSQLRYTVHLQKLTSLEIVECAYGTINDSVIQDIAHVRSLMQLRLSRCQDVTDVGLASLARCLNLQVLVLSDFTITGESLTPLTNLRKLEIEGCCVYDQGMASIASLPKLEDLTVIDCGIDDRTFDLITRSTSLKKLCIGQYGSTVDNNGLEAIASLILLEDFRILDGNWLDQDMLINISKVPRLRRLELHCRDIDELDTSIFSEDVQLVLCDN